MSEFKPMVKMMTTEPSVILKLKKGGSAKMDCDMDSNGFKTMKKAMGGSTMDDMGGMPADGEAPMRPSMSARRAAMDPRKVALLKKAIMAAKMSAAAAPKPPMTPASGMMPQGAPAPMMKKGGKVHKDASEDRAMIKKAMAGKKFADGGIIMSKSGEAKVVTAPKGAKCGASDKDTFAKGGMVKKKFADGGNVVDTGKAEKMPAHPISKPVSNTAQSGTFKDGGVAKKAKGGSTYPNSDDKPNLRLFKTIAHPTNGKVAKVYKDKDWGEYRTKFFENGKHLTEADHHTDDKSDASDTASSWINKRRGGAVKRLADGGPSYIDGGLNDPASSPYDRSNDDTGTQVADAVAMRKKGGKAK